jgi:hypothetical protein
MGRKTYYFEVCSTNAKEFLNHRFSIIYDDSNHIWICTIDNPMSSKLALKFPLKKDKNTWCGVMNDYLNGFRITRRRKRFDYDNNNDYHRYVRFSITRFTSKSGLLGPGETSGTAGNVSGGSSNIQPSDLFKEE